MEIRVATNSDVEVIMALYSELMEFEMSLLNGDMKEIQLNWERKKTREDIEKILNDENMNLFVAEDSGGIQGFITGGISKGVKHPEGALDVYIREEHRGKGVGTRLMDRLCVRFREQGCKSVLVNAYAVNEPARRFYKKYGLELLGETYKKKL